MRRVLPVLLAAASFAGAAPVRVVFDTDMGNDIDDAVALAILHALESRGEAKLLAVTITKENTQAAAFVDIVGTNLARLLEAAPEPLARKARLLSVMAGAFPSGKPEYNVRIGMASARKVFAEWPSPVVFSGWEVGAAMPFPAASIDKEFTWAEHHPVADSCRAYGPMPYDRPTWDPTAALYAVRPERGYFSLSAPGRVGVDGDGRTVFTPAAEGRHRYPMVSETQRARTLEAMIALARQPR